MTDRELLQQMIDRIGKEPRAVKFDDDGILVELNLAGLDLEEVPDEVYSFAHLRILALGETHWEQGKMRRIGNRIRSLDPAIGQCLALEELWVDNNRIPALPEVVADLPNLRVLKYENNDLACVPALVWKLSRLETLWLDANGIEELPTALFDLLNLKSLTLNDNKITQLSPLVAQLTNLQDLYLDSNQLTSVPPELAQLVNLQEFWLDSNQLTSLPPELAQLVNLQKLWLSSNQLTSLPSELAQLVNLQTLSLHSNQLTSVPSELARLVNLQELWLDSNQLTSLPSELAQLVNLQMLSLANNQLTSVPPELAQLVNLQMLSLANNQLTSVPPELAQLVNLQELSLSNNQLTSVPPELAQLVNLQELSLSNNQLTSVPPELAQIVNLQELSLSNNQLASVPPELTQLVNLQTLGLSSNQLTSVPPELAQLANLESLWLSNNQLTSLPSELAQLVNLHALGLSSNQLTSVPPELSQLINLQEIWLHSNQLTSLPSELSQLVNLQKLNLHSNQLTSVPPVLAQLVNLQKLSLANNQLTSVPPELAQLVNLQMLWLSSNQLTSVPPELAQLVNLQTLDLSSNQLTSVPSELDQLVNLQTLDLSSNQLSSVPPELARLVNLQELWLDSNQLTSVPPELTYLINLQKLGLANNQLTSVPLELAQLVNLQKLWLDSNHLTFLPPELAQLVNLQTLILDSNQLTRVPPELAQLVNLQTLSLSNNQLTSVPPELVQLVNLQRLWLDSNQLTSVPHSFASLVKLNELYLSDNPLRTPPPEIAEKGAATVCAYLTRLDNTSIIRYQAKLLLVGEGATGKSSLLRALCGQDFNAHLSTTHGVDILPIDLPFPDRHDMDLTLHVWDFGGQQIYHTTHQFFMTRRSLYLLVWNARWDTDQGRLDHWLRKIQALAPGSPVLLVATHSDERPPEINLGRFRTSYPQIVGMATTSNKTGVGLEELKTAIAAEAAKLPLMEQEWPRAWVEVEEALQAADQPHVSGQEFAAICARSGVNDAFEQQVLGGYLHDLGKILYHQDDDVLCDFVVLKPNWLTQAMARVLDDAVTRDQRHGVLDHADFPRIWHGYDRRLYPVFLRMLERFLISYQLEEPEPGRRQSMVPLLLPHSPPAQLPPWTEVMSDQPEVRMVFDLDFVPDGIMSWFIVLTHHYSQDLHWREGVRLHYDGHQADVVLNPSTRQLWLQVRGPAPSNFFTILQYTINERITRYFEGLTYRRRVPCICYKARGEAAACTHYFDYDKVVERKQRSRPTIECDRTYDQVSVTELLEGIHYTTLDQLGEKVDRILEVVGENRELLLQVRQLSEQSLREQTRMWNVFTKNLFSEAPSVFVIMPGDRRSFDPRGLLSEDYLLYLLCQHPAGPHMVAGEKGYQAPKDREWWRQVRPWLRQLSKILKFVPKLSDLAKAYDEQWYKSIDLSLEIYDASAEAFPEFAPQAERVARRELDAVMGKEVELEGAALRALHVFLREVDKTQHWCALKRVVTNDGNILWLCAEHARFHEV